MNASKKAINHKTLKQTPKFKVRITLFWRLFLSLLLTIIITSILSIMVERWLVEKALTARMNVQTDSLLIKRQEMVEALRAGDLSTVKQMYRQDRQLMNQISVYDEEGAIIFPRYRNRDERRQKGMQGSRREVGQPSMQSMAAQPNVDNNRINSHDDNNKMSNDKSSFLNHILQPMMPNSATLAPSRFLPDLSLNCVIRLSHPIRAVPFSSHCSSAWAGTRA